ncbi:hypothetical protein ANAEL_04250 [Anaerolineales bacterium]|nr:hypothetical protein ANAEL_04250 [Anaerolineales bacterium]
MKNFLHTSAVLIFLLTACNLPSSPTVDTPVEPTSVPPTALPTNTAANPTPAPPTETSVPPTVTPTSTNTPIPVVESLDATVTADLLSCRYGPGAEYLYLYGLKKGANIQLIGRTDGNNWVMVKGKNLCWLNAKFVEIKGDPQTLRVTYPSEYRLPVSPYYTGPTVLSATRNPNNPNEVTVKWTDITLRAGDEEDENMFIYIIEVWRCEGSKTVFDPLASNYPEVTFIDEAGCDIPSHGRVFFQEKHGFAGPADIPWPED